MMMSPDLIANISEELKQIVGEEHAQAATGKQSYVHDSPFVQGGVLAVVLPASTYQVSSVVRPCVQTLDPTGILNPHKICPEGAADGGFLARQPAWA